MLLVSPALVPLFSEVHLLEWQGLSLLGCLLDVLSSILQDSLLEVELLHSQEHASFLKTMSFSRLFVNFVQSLNESLLVIVSNVLVNMVVEVFIILGKPVNFIFDLSEILSSKLLILHQLVKALHLNLSDALLGHLGCKVVSCNLGRQG